MTITFSERPVAHSAKCVSSLGFVEATAQLWPGANPHSVASRSHAARSSAGSPRTGSCSEAPTLRQNLIRLLPMSTTASGTGGPSGRRGFGWRRVRRGRESGRWRHRLARQLVQLHRHLGHELRQALARYGRNGSHVNAEFGRKAVAHFVVAGQLGLADRHELRLLREARTVKFEFPTDCPVILHRVAAVGWEGLDQVNEHPGPLDVAQELVPKPDPA